MNIRKAAVAGSFYPNDKPALEKMLTDLLKSSPVLSEQYRAIIAPHAGFIYSGSIAARAYMSLHALKNTINRVVILGPAHRVAFRGLALSSADFFETPLGLIPIDKTESEKLLSFNQVSVNDEAHLQEHSVEVQLPFIQSLLDDFTILPIVVGDADAKIVYHILDLFWQDTKTFIVISSDLSHFHHYDEAVKIDQRTSEAILQLSETDINYEHACGRNPIAGLLTLAKKEHLSAHLIGLNNSGDTVGDKQSVVGYGAYGFN